MTTLNFVAKPHDYMLTALEWETWLRESPVYLVEGATPRYGVVFPWGTTVGATPTLEVYKDGSSTDTAGTYMTGTVGVGGRVTTWKAFQALVPGKYVVVMNATIDSVPRVWKCGFVVFKQEALWGDKPNNIWLERNPARLVEGATPTIKITFPWATTIAASPTVEIYKDESSTNSADTYMPAGSHSGSGNTLTAKPLAVLVPGKYVIVFNATVDGILDVWKLGMVVQKQEALW